ncbi:hypothetical protein D3C80_1589030 [compost metagenome]
MLVKQVKRLPRALDREQRFAGITVEQVPPGPACPPHVDQQVQYHPRQVEVLRRIDAQRLIHPRDANPRDLQPCRLGHEQRHAPGLAKLLQLILADIAQHLIRRQAVQAGKSPAQGAASFRIGVLLFVQTLEQLPSPCPGHISQRCPALAGCLG